MNQIRLDQYPASIAELRVLWSKAFGSSLPDGLGRALLARGIAWKHQADHGGTISATVERELIGLARQLERSGAIRIDRRSGLKVGTRLVREWGGNTHTVEVLENGFRYLDEHYSSLSIVAQVITGVKWSGPRFFGLKQSVQAFRADADA